LLPAACKWFKNKVLEVTDMASDALSTYLTQDILSISLYSSKQENNNMEKWALFEICQNQGNYCLCF